MLASLKQKVTHQGWIIIQVHSHNQYLFMHHACFKAHTFDQLVYALVSYIPHAFTLVLLELVASAMLFPCKQQLLINARMNQHAYG